MFDTLRDICGLRLTIWVRAQRWDVFRKVKEGDKHLEAVCMRYSRMIERAERQAEAEEIYQAELVSDLLQKTRLSRCSFGSYRRGRSESGRVPY